MYFVYWPIAHTPPHRIQNDETKETQKKTHTHTTNQTHSEQTNKHTFCSGCDLCVRASVEEFVCAYAINCFASKLCTLCAHVHLIIIARQSVCYCHFAPLEFIKRQRCRNAFLNVECEKLSVVIFFFLLSFDCSSVPTHMMQERQFVRVKIYL